MSEACKGGGPREHSGARESEAAEGVAETDEDLQLELLRQAHELQVHGGGFEQPEAFGGVRRRQHHVHAVGCEVLERLQLALLSPWQVSTAYKIGIAAAAPLLGGDGPSHGAR